MTRANSVTGFTIEQAITDLQDADLIVGHNVIRFDIPAIQKLYPSFAPRGTVRDTTVSTQLIWPSDILRPKDFILAEKGTLPKNLIGRYSLMAWGHRIGTYKVPDKQDFSQWSQELEDYCVQDVEVTYKLWNMIVSKQYSEFAMWLEHSIAAIIHEQERFGAPFDEKAAGALYAELVQARLDRERECQALFGPWLAPGALFTPKKDDPYNKVNKKRFLRTDKHGTGYVAGAECQKLKEMVFNPGSRQHIADRLMKVRGWKPTAFTATGDPEVNEVILAALPYPEAKILTRYLLVQKRVGQLAEGDKALLKFVKNGRIHGRVLTNSTVTARAAHADPNLGQVPKVKAKKIDGVTTILKGEAGGWGWEFRDLFRVPSTLIGWKLVGTDASGLELRMLGHFMTRWDGGAYAREVIEGDVHTKHQIALGSDSRDKSKTWFYAFLYGAGAESLGVKMGGGKALGKKLTSRFLKGLPALNSLIEAVRAKHRTVKHLIGLDKRIVYTRSEHAALNTLLQTAGALVCKLWIVLLHRALLRHGYVPGRDYQQVLWVHDEVQILARSEVADEIGKIAKAAVKEAGEYFGLKIPLDGEYKVGNTWAETH